MGHFRDIYGGMFVKFSHRSRAYTHRRREGQEPYRAVIVQLVESHRVDGHPRQRIVAHLGTCHEPIDRDRHRLWFHQHCNEVLDRLDLSADDRAKVAAQIAARISPPTPEEMAEMEREADAAISRLSIAMGHPDRLATLVRAWNAASDSEQAQFLDVLRQSGVI